MATQVISNAKVWLGQYDVSGDVNALAIRYGADIQDATTIGDTSRVRRAGLKSFGMQLDGFVNPGTGLADECLNAFVGAADTPVVIGPLTGADGELAFASVLDLASYAPGAAVGEMHAFSASGEGSGDLIRGTLMHNATRSTTGTGTIRQLGAASATQKVYAGLIVTAASGSTPTLAVKVQSAAAAGFGTANDRITFSTANAAGAQWATPVAGAITDQYWRVSYTIGGSTPSFSFVVFIGIQ
jgi:hypothetical protein